MRLEGKQGLDHKGCSIYHDQKLGFDEMLVEGHKLKVRSKQVLKI